MDNKSKLDLCFKINDSYYLGATIRFNHTKIELYYFFPFSDNIKTEYKEIDSGDVKKAYLIDHISFHKDGKIHTYTKELNSNKFYFNKLDPGINVFNLEKGKFLPILLDIIILEDDSIFSNRLKKIDVVENINDLFIWDLNGKSEFSIILVSMCELVNPENIIKNHGFENLKLIGKPLLLKDVFNNKYKIKGSGFGTNLAILIVENIAEPELKFKLEKAFCIGGTLTLPPMKLIANMKIKNM